MDMSNPRVDIKQAPACSSQRILAEQIKAVISQIPGSIVPAVVATAASAVMFWRTVPRLHLAFALLVIYLATLLLFNFYRSYLRCNQSALESVEWARRLVQRALVHGCSLGLFGLMIFVPGSMPDQMLAMALMYSFVAGAMSASGQYFPACVAYAAPVILPIIGRCFFDGSLESAMIGTVGFFGLCHILLTAFNTQRNALKEIQTSFENKDLVSELEQQKEKVERALAQAELANQSKSRFLAAASHDLRQPVHALGLFVSAAKNTVSEPERKRIVDRIDDSVVSLTALFDSLLDVSRLDAGILQPEIKTVALAPILQKMLSEFTPQAQEKKLHLRVRCREMLVRTDPLLFERMLRNLITNSIRYTTSSGGILLAGRKRGDKVVVQIWDSGIGIAPEQQAQVFEEFYQVGNPERDRRHGVGLGLAIVKRLAKLLQHPLRLDSRVNQGTRFSLEMPISHVIAEEGVFGQPAEDDETVLFGAVITVIDDEADILGAVELLLKQWGCVVIAAGSGAQAQEKLQAEDMVPDLILSDYRLRDNETGIDAIRKLRAIYGDDVPALLVTGDTAAQRLREAAVSGLQVLHKPLNAEQLKQALIKMLA